MMMLSAASKRCERNELFNCGSVITNEVLSIARGHTSSHNALIFRFAFSPQKKNVKSL